VDLFGPSSIASLGGKKCAFVIIDHYSRLTWVIFLALKRDCLNEFIKLGKRLQNEKGYLISSIRSDHGGEFENALFKKICQQNGISHNFSTPRTPQQNEVVERKN
jgi:transposase InsO family protein